MVSFEAPLCISTDIEDKCIVTAAADLGCPSDRGTICWLFSKGRRDVDSQAIDRIFLSQ